MQSRRFTAALLTLLLVYTASAQTPDYEIKLVRPPKIGQKYNLAIDGAMTRHVTFTAGEEKKATDDGFGVHLEGLVTVVEVNKDGEEAKATCKVTKFTRFTPGGETELLPAGRVITATGGKSDTSYALDNKDELTDDVKEALDLVLPMGEDDGYNDDRIYGTKKRQHVGDSWPLDAKASSDEAKDDDVHFDPKDCTGSLKLEKLETIDGVECLLIAGSTEIKQLTTKAPEKMTFDKGSLKAKYSGTYPVDTSIGTLAETMSVTHTATFKGKNAEGKETVIDSKVQRATEMKRTFLK